MLSEFLDFLYQEVSPPVLCGAGGVTVFAVVGALDWFLTSSWVEFKARMRQKQRYMKGIVLRSYGGLKSIEIAGDLLVPRIRECDEVLIKVVAAGVDRIDFKICHGYGRAMRSYMRGYCKDRHSDFPVILGRECSGVVTAVGSSVSTVAEGDEVWAVSSYCQEGLMAEYVVVKESQVALKPKSLSFAEAASLPYVAVLTWNALIIQAQLGPATTAGKRILVHASNTPCGLFAIQLLKAWGGHVTATVPTTGLPMCRVLKSDDVIVYTVVDFQFELRKRRKFDIVLNTVGTVLHRFCVDRCSKGGRVITFATTPALSDRYGCLLGSLLSIVLHFCFWLRKLSLGAVWHLWLKSISFDNEALIAVTELIQRNKIRPIIEEVYPLQKAPEAYRQLATYKTVGKAVISFAE